MDDNSLEDLVRRLTALVVKIDERDSQMVTMLEEQHEFNRQQVQLNQRMDATLTAIKDLLQRWQNGR
jgi:hypothetical protein